MEVNGQLQAPDAYPRRRAPNTHLIGGLMGPRAELDFVEEK